MAVLSHALLFIASLLAPAHGAADVALCQSVPSQEDIADIADIANVSHLTPTEHTQRTWARSPHPYSVRVYAAFRARDVAPLRVLGRCVVKPAPEHQQPVLFSSFAGQLDDSDDENLASERTGAGAAFAFPSAVGAGRPDMYVMRAPRTQLERPPRA